MTVGFVDCEIEPGMFENELLVYVNGPDELSVQIFVDEDLVDFSGSPERGKRIKGQLQVSIVNRSRGFATIVLPKPGIPVGNMMIVNESTLS